MSSKFAEQLGDLEKRYFLFRRQLKTFLDALRFFRENTNQAQGQLRTVREMEGLLNGAGQANATYKGAVKLWFEVYDELRSVIQNQLVAAQACAPEVTDEVLKIRVAEALEYVNEITQPDYDVVENELEKRIQEDLHDMRHDELFQMNFSDRRMFGSMVAMLPLAIDALARATKLTSTLEITARSAVQSRQQTAESTKKGNKSSAASVASRSQMRSRSSTSQSKKPWRPSGPVTPQIRKTSSIL
ncbi:uncharacterized protein LOC134839065 isoform X2 [Symsagittifera roscoffensis]|uniref:uncharacterized protein LOC134839065 isoform X2 n=1 Tax=Symsagittifera roscoffensis TaxID=84072 RepID=UPI00307B1BDD